MADIIPVNQNDILSEEEEKDISPVEKMTKELLDDVRASNLPVDKTIAMPISQLSSLGAGVSSLIPATTTITKQIPTDGLFRVANKAVGETLKAAKDGTFWGSLKKVGGGSKMAKWEAVNSIKATETIASTVNPAMLMMSVALFSIEQELGKIAEMEKQILTFLEVEKEAEIESDVETLTEMINKYKFNWDNEHYITSSHKMVLDIQRTARKNMLSFQKRVADDIKSEKLIIAQNKVDNMLKDLEKKFKYYRLALYTFSLASFMEIMLSGNFKEENINSTYLEIENYSREYRKIFSDCSIFLEKNSKKSIKTNLLKGASIYLNTVGTVIGNMPLIKKGPVDEFLIEKGDIIKSNAKGISEEVVGSFAEVSNPNTSMFLNKMKDMIRIYNKTENIYIDKDNIYLVSE